jgi:hypothetical protein
MKHTNWLAGAWAAADRLAHTLTWRFSAGSGLVIIPRRQEKRTAHGFMLASILSHVGRFPAIVVCAAEQLDAQQRAIRQRLPQAQLAVIDWCHPATLTPADITLITPQVLQHRQQAALSGYQAAVIAVIGAQDTQQARYLRAVNTLMHSGPSPLLVVEEWADPEVIATAVGRIARVTPSVAKHAVTSWREERIRCGGLHTVRNGEMARSVLARCAPAQPDAA